ncbi:MAG: hypothetical protein UT34_C0001G0011 [candidate division WS6 bacterium GW2011_GWF2_39_15]|uniref:Uncharacterized protein n=1 Tax=candidate division WS6 bacterium GW2011_GWF2_39_15 TaxID=1619100 RepID=A0A0G0MZD8_9BACT|nr:MAG: hypothetical protein UT34_C0001G0011 [candidate division WS6 bacterium GW2011_GWF2_39_15]
MIVYIMFSVIDGKTPVLLSAPHVYNHYRKNLNGVVKQGELWTDSIVKETVSLSGCNGIIVDKDVDYDPNYDKLENNEYKQKVDKIIKDKKIKYFFDIHGLSDSHCYDFGIFFPFRYLKSQKLAYTLAQELLKGPLRDSIVIVLNMCDDNQETLTEYVAKKKKIPAVQLEIARYIREDDALREALISTLSKVILTLN